MAKRKKSSKTVTWFSRSGKKETVEERKARLARSRWAGSKKGATLGSRLGKLANRASDGRGPKHIA